MSIKGDYFPFVRHELKNQLIVIREGVSQVLDGLGNKDCPSCFAILKPALECVDNMDALIVSLVSDEIYSKMADGKGRAMPADTQGSLAGIRKKMLELAKGMDNMTGAQRSELATSILRQLDLLLTPSK